MWCVCVCVCVRVGGLRPTSRHKINHMVEHDRAPLCRNDAPIVQYIATHVPDAFARLDADMICSFVRSYRSYKKPLETTVKYIQETLSWRNSIAYDCSDSLRDPPKGRDEFERMYQAGPIGRDKCGRVVVLERIGQIPAKELCARFSAADVVQHSVYNRESAMTLNRKLSHENGRLIQRITPLVDLKGFGWDHLSRDFLHRTRVLINTLTTPYPDSTSGFYIINSPALFSILWKAVRPMLDDETAAMVKVLGGPSKYVPALAEMGVAIDGDADLETVNLSWQRTMLEVAPEGVKPPPFVYPSDAKLLLSAAHSLGIAAPAGLAELAVRRRTSSGLLAQQLLRRRSSGVARAISDRLPYLGSAFHEGMGSRGNRHVEHEPSLAPHAVDGSSAASSVEAGTANDCRRAVAEASAMNDGGDLLASHGGSNVTKAETSRVGTRTLLCAAGFGVAVVALLVRANPKA